MAKVTLSKTRWLSYEQRIKEDLEVAYSGRGAAKFFSEEYSKKLEHYIDEVESSVRKLVFAQLVVTAFLLLSFLPGDSAITIAGVTIKTFPGVKECLLVLGTSLGIVQAVLNYFNSSRIAVLEKLSELQAPKSLVDFARLATRKNLMSTFYITRRSNSWIFSTPLTASIHLLLTVLFAALVLLATILSFSIHVYVIVFVLQHPSLPATWSSLAMTYVILGDLFIFSSLLASLPLPYRDDGVYLELKKLREKSPAAYEKRLDELLREKYGPAA